MESFMRAGNRLAPTWLLLLLLAACGRAPAPAPLTTSAGGTDAATPAAAFALERATAESWEDRPAIVLQFSRTLAGAQKFDQLARIERKDGGAIDGSFALDADGRRLRFPYLEADQTYVVRLAAELAAADGSTLGSLLEREIYTGPLAPLLGFASQGSVLPAHESRGLPIVSVNVSEVDLEFLRVREQSFNQFLSEFQRNGRKSYWSLSQVARYADPVYANRFALASETNQRTVSHIPIRGIEQLSAPGLYFAVMKRPGRFESEFDASMFVVSDLGLHARVYRDRLLVHVASLESGAPQGKVALEVRDDKGTIVASAETDGDGLAQLDYRLKASHIVIARWGRDLNLLPFAQAALDLSEFAIGGRPQRAAEVFPWSGRDLYRPGETVRVSALLRDGDGKPVPPQPLFATLRQPDGRPVLQQQLGAGDLGYYEFVREIPRDAATGRWSVDFSVDPTTSSADHAFRFRVEEFLPERLKLELVSASERLRPGQALSLAVDAAYLYGAPAAGNRFSVSLAVANAAHPIATLPDFFFGDALAELPREPREVLDATLDAEGRWRGEIGEFIAGTPSGPVQVALQGSVYETGGRAVARNLVRTIWPAETLIGVRPLFELADGAPPESAARFEVIRSNAAGELLAASGLAVKLIRERRDYNWTWDQQTGWRADFVSRFETVEERTLDIAAGARGELGFDLDWGPYRLEIADPETGLTLRLPFESGWGGGERGTDARPDKVKLVLDRAAYRGGDKIVVTLTPPHPGPALLLLESDRLLWHTTREVRAGSMIEFTLDPEWERHDLYLSALVFRPGSAPERITPKRAVGVAHIPIDRSERRVEVALSAAETSRPGDTLKIAVDAPALAGTTARVRVSAVDLGVINITRFPMPDASAWFFAQRRLGLEAWDIYGRVIESLDGSSARLRYGGDMALPALPAARRPDAEVQTVDLFHAPIALDAAGKGEVPLVLPDFNGSLRLRALVYGADRYGAAERDSIVRAPLVAEASLPRVLAPGDRSWLTLDLQNLSGERADYRLAYEVEGPIALEASAERIVLDDQERRTLRLPLAASGSFGVGRVTARIEGPDIELTRRFRVTVRPAWPAVARSRSAVLEQPRAVSPPDDLLAGLIPDSVAARTTVSTLPPLPFAATARALLGYPYGCVEQTTSRALPLVWLDDETRDRLGIGNIELPDASGALVEIDGVRRSELLEGAFARLAAMQLDNGHFAMWPGSTDANTPMTPYVIELLLDARDAGFAVPDTMLQRALERLNEDLLAGGNSFYAYDNYEHLRLAEMAHAGYVLARVNRAPLGTLRALFDNEREKLVAPLPLAHLAAGLALMGDRTRADTALNEAFETEFTRPLWLGDYGSRLRDLALMLALAHEHELAQPQYDQRAFDLARELFGGGTNHYLSTQEQGAILRLGRALVRGAPRSFGASVRVGSSVSESTGRAVVSRSFTAAELASGVSIVPSGGAPLYVVHDATGTPRAPEVSNNAALRITRRWYRSDGTEWKPAALAEGEVLIAHLRVESAETMADALIVDLTPGGLEVENLNLTDATQWQNVSIDGITLSERSAAASTRFEEYRDDRYVAAVNLYGGSPAHLFYLVRAVSPGDFVVPPPVVEDMYRPNLRAAGRAQPERIEVGVR
jgi:uncharacterized protein YfaS (alpha-2-macroglobulin family)